jgi:hypothetical protein
MIHSETSRKGRPFPTDRRRAFQDDLTPVCEPKSQLLRHCVLSTVAPLFCIDDLKDTTMLTGSCLCGRITYEAEVSPAPFVHCHCHICRKAHGSAFSSVMSIPRQAFRWIKGEELLTSYESSPGKFRRFCSGCGSHILAERVNQPNVLLRLGCLDTPISDKANAHIWRSDGASWYDPRDNTPEFTAGVIQQT